MWPTRVSHPWDEIHSQERRKRGGVIGQIKWVLIITCPLLCIHHVMIGSHFPYLYVCASDLEMTILCVKSYLQVLIRYNLWNKNFRFMAIALTTYLSLLVSLGVPGVTFTFFFVKKCDPMIRDKIHGKLLITSFFHHNYVTITRSYSHYEKCFIFKGL